MKRTLDIALRYGVAVLVVGVALLIKLLLDPLTVQDTPFLLVFGAIIVSAWYGGAGSGGMGARDSVLGGEPARERGALQADGRGGQRLRDLHARSGRMRNDLERRRRAHRGLR